MDCQSGSVALINPSSLHLQVNENGLERAYNVCPRLKYFSKDIARGILLLPDPRELNSNRQDIFCRMGGFSDVITNAGENDVSDFAQDEFDRNQVYFINKFDVQVGRIRYDLSDESKSTINLFLSGDQLLKGAALNAYQICDLVYKKNEHMHYYCNKN